MAAINTLVSVTRFAKDSQVFLTSSLIARNICSTKFKSDLMPGRTIDFPYQSDVRVQSYTYSTDLTIDGQTATSSTYSIDQVKAATGNIDPLQNQQGHTLGLQAQISQRIGYRLAQNIDQYVINTAVGNTASTVAGGTLSASNMFEKLTDCMSTLGANEARPGSKFVILDYPRIATLAQVDKANGFNLADSTLVNGFVGNTAAGFKVYVSNNLPFTFTNTMATIPTAGDTFSFMGETWTWAASGAATAARDISIGANAAAAQANFILAINGTGTPGATTYIDTSTYKRRQMQGRQATASAFATNVSTVTYFGKATPSAVFTTGTNVFGTETGSTVAGIEGAIDLTVQTEPYVDVRGETKNLSQNLIGVTQFGAGVFFLDKNSLVKFTFNA